MTVGKGSRRMHGPGRPIAAVVALCVLAGTGCVAKGALDGASVETVRIDGRLFEVRIAPADVANEYRILVVRAAMLIEPDPEHESSRAKNVAKPFLERTCKGPYRVIDEKLVDSVNFYQRFRCGG